jgi:hypothetical protein
MVAVTVRIGVNALLTWEAWIIALGSVAVVFGPRRVNAAWIVLAGALLGFVLHQI